MGDTETASVTSSKGGIYEVPADMIKGMGMSSASSSSALGSSAEVVVPVPGSAVIAPSSVVHKASPQIHIRHRELDPSQVDTGKDTQQLVEDSTEC